MSICQGYILYTSHIALRLLTCLLAPNWRSGRGKVLLSVADAHKPVDFIVGRLLGETVVPQQVDDIVMAT